MIYCKISNLIIIIILLIVINKKCITVSNTEQNILYKNFNPEALYISLFSFYNAPRTVKFFLINFSQVKKKKFYLAN